MLTGGADTGGGGAAPTASCATADALMGFNPKGAMVSFEEPGDRYYGLFNAAEGDWFAVYARELPAKADVVIRLWDETGTELLASSDHHMPAFPGVFDGTMYHHVSESRTYCLEILDFQDWKGAPESAGIYDFEVRVRSVAAFWGSGLDVVRYDEGDNDTVASAQAIPMDPAVATAVILGTFDTDEDVDVYTLQGQASGPFFAWRGFALSPSGKGSDDGFGWGSTSDVTMTLLAPDGVTVVARRSAADASAACDFETENCFGILVPEVELEDYILVVERAGSAPVAADDAYSIYTGQINVPLTASEGPDGGANDTLANAELLSPTVVDGDLAYQFDGTLDDGDVDWWYVPTTDPSETLKIWCGSAFQGSGVEAFTVEAYKDDDTGGAPFQMQTETPTQRIRWWPPHPKYTPVLPPLPGGTGYYFKMSSASFSSDVTSRGYYCQIYHGAGS